MKAIDLFAGAGGFTDGATRAGASVLWAANHWPVAVETHGRNHPETIHACQDLTQADFTACVEARRPANVLVENVPEFLDWSLYDVWRLALERYGYHVTEHIFDAADFGVAQERRRAFILARQAGRLELVAPDRDRVSLGEIVDWSAGRWSRVSEKVPATRDQVARARAKHGDRCAIVYNGSRNAGRSLAAPAPTVTTIDRLALIDGDRMRMLSVDEYRRAMGFSAGYRLPTRKRDAVKLLGNAVCPPVAEELVAQLRRAA